MYKSLILFSVLLLSTCQVGAIEEGFRLDGQAEPSSYIYGMVNAITGTLLESSQDLTVDCPEPISFIRHYSSQNYYDKYYGMGFTHNHPTKVEGTIIQFPYKKIALEDSGGDMMWFSAKKNKNVEEKRPVFVH